MGHLDLEVADSVLRSLVPQHHTLRGGRVVLKLPHEACTFRIEGPGYLTTEVAVRAFDALRDVSGRAPLVTVRLENAK